MITYPTEVYGFRILFRLHGSAVFRSLTPAVLSSVIYLALWYSIEDLTYDPQRRILDHPYTVGALVSAFTFLLAFRANFSYNRYWEAVSSVYQMHSKWLDVGIQLAAFHLQSKMYERQKPPTFAARPEVTSIERERERINEPTPEEFLEHIQLLEEAEVIQQQQQQQQNGALTHMRVLAHLLPHRHRTNSSEEQGFDSSSQHTAEGDTSPPKTHRRVVSMPSSSTSINPFSFSPRKVKSRKQHANLVATTTSAAAVPAIPLAASSGPDVVITMNEVQSQSSPAIFTSIPSHDELEDEENLATLQQTVPNRLSSPLSFVSASSHMPTSSLPPPPPPPPPITTTAIPQPPAADTTDLPAGKKKTANIVPPPPAAVLPTSSSTDTTLPPPAPSDRPPKSKSINARRERQSSQDSFGVKLHHHSSADHFAGFEIQPSIVTTKISRGGLEHETPALFLQEGAHLLSLLSAVAMSTLRNDLEEAETPLIPFTPGAPWPHVDPDSYSADVRKGWTNSTHKSWTILQYLLGLTRTDASRTLYNAARPFRVIGGVSDAEIEVLQSARGPLAKVALCSLWLQEFMTREHLAGSTGEVAPPIISRLYQNASEGMLAYNQARKVVFIPFPFPHAQITSLFVLVIVGFTPVLMLSFVKNITLGFLLNLLTVMCFTGLHEVARELESPFQNVPNDIPANNIHFQYNEALMTMFSGYHPDAFWQIAQVPTPSWKKGQPTRKMYKGA